MRTDNEIITEIIAEKAKVLDVGCGEGDLLQMLFDKKQVDGRGIEINQQRVSVAVSRGLSVIQGDADIDLRDYPAASFDYVILGQTIQATKNPKEILNELLRISSRAVVSLPNFGYWYNRFYLAVFGEMPVTKTLSYQWYDTPNIHFCTINDFIKLCRENNIMIEKKIYLDAARNKLKPALPPNLFAEQGIFLLKKIG